MGMIDKVGLGYDIHRLVQGRMLKLAGVPIDSDKGLLGHSDGDVVLHAVIDAMLGAAGLEDIGQIFPDSDPAYKDADSAQLLGEALQRVRRAGYRLANVDLVIHVERPKLSPYKQAMRRRLAELVALDVAAVNIKAKTAEGLGPVGEGRAIACTAVVGLTKA